MQVRQREEKIHTVSEAVLEDKMEKAAKVPMCDICIIAQCGWQNPEKNSVLQSCPLLGHFGFCSARLCLQPTEDMVLLHLLDSIAVRSAAPQTSVADPESGSVESVSFPWIRIRIK